jgi:hypothetical protein
MYNQLFSRPLRLHRSSGIIARMQFSCMCVVVGTRVFSDVDLVHHELGRARCDLHAALRAVEGRVRVLAFCDESSEHVRRVRARGHAPLPEAARHPQIRRSGVIPAKGVKGSISRG